MSITLDELRRYAVARNFPPPTTLKRAINRMGFVQADPIRAPARAQDLILRHRVKNYRAGDLERCYESLDVDEDVFVNYGFVNRDLQELMHPRSESGGNNAQTATKRRREQLLLDFVRQHGAVHPRQVDEHFAHGRVTNYWGGSSNATTQLLEDLHYRGLLRVVRREKGIRVYRATSPDSGAGSNGAASKVEPLDAAAREERIDKLVETVVRIYGPLPSSSLTYYVRRLRYAAPQWSDQLTDALQRARQRLAHAHVDGLEWYWAEDKAGVDRKAAAERRAAESIDDKVRLLAPFDPLVHDRARFALFWGWEYRFEAYTPVAKRKLGYYALPLLWRDRVIGWANLANKNGELAAEIGYATTQPRERAFKRELDAELERIRASFLRPDRS